MKDMCTSFLRIHRSHGSAAHMEDGQQILGECINRAFLLSVSDALTSGALLTLEDSLSLLPVPTDSKQLTFSTPSICKVNKQSRVDILPPPTSYSAVTLWTSIHLL